MGGFCDSMKHEITIDQTELGMSGIISQSEKLPKIANPKCEKPGISIEHTQGNIKPRGILILHMQLM